MQPRWGSRTGCGAPGARLQRPRGADEAGGRARAPPTALSPPQPPARRPPGPDGPLQRRLRLPARALQPRVRLRRPHLLLALPCGVPRGGRAQPGRPEGEWPPPTCRPPRPGRAPVPSSCNQRCCCAPQVYRDCSCVPQNFSSGFGHATAGKCTSTCQRKPLLLVFIFVVIIFTFLSSIPALTATLR